MTMHDPTPHNMAIIMILKEDLHYIQRAARRAKKPEPAFLHDVIEKHRYSGSQPVESGTKRKQLPDAAGLRY